MCAEMGIETGIDLEKLIECARLAEEVVGHPLPGSVMVGGSLSRLRQKLSAAYFRSYVIASEAKQSPSWRRLHRRAEALLAMTACS